MTRSTEFWVYRASFWITSVLSVFSRRPEVVRFYSCVSTSRMIRYTRLQNSRSCTVSTWFLHRSGTRANRSVGVLVSRCINESIRERPASSDDHARYLSGPRRSCDFLLLFKGSFTGSQTPRGLRRIVEKPTTDERRAVNTTIAPREMGRRGRTRSETRTRIKLISAFSFDWRV